MTDEEYDYGELLVVQHADHAGPSGLTSMLDGRAVRRPWWTVRPDRGEDLPGALDRVRGVLVLGGPVGVGDREELGWLDTEIRWLADVVDRDVPVFGICLGHQLLAAALGGEVRPRARPEIGFLPITRTEAGQEDEVFAGWPDRSVTLVIHDDEVVRLPDGAALMATGTDGITAFRAADGRSYGVQFHPETSAELLADWCAREGNRARFERAGVDPDGMADEGRRREPFLRAVGLALVGRWIDGVVGADDPKPRRRPRKSTAG